LIQKSDERALNKNQTSIQKFDRKKKRKRVEEFSFSEAINVVS
jgi:hypothetical protein